MKNSRTIVLSVLSVILVVGVALAAQGGLFSGVLAQTPTPAPAVDVSRTILVVGEGTVSIVPDRAQAIIGVETTGATVREATQESSEIMEALLEALREEGVAERDIQTSGYSVWTERNGRMLEPGLDRPEETVTYRVNNTVRVTVVELDNLSAILDAAIDAGANSIHGISFTISDPSRLETQARIRAIANAKAKAEELADLTGVQVGQVVSVSEVVGMGGFPMLRDAAMGMGGGAGPISPGEMDFTLQLQVIYSIR
jgi:uncharacterized protein